MVSDKLGAIQSANRAAAFLFFTDAPKVRQFAFIDLCREKRWDFEQAMILRSDSMFHHGAGFIVPWLHLTKADGIAYRFGMAAFIYMERGLPVRLVTTG